MDKQTVKRKLKRNLHKQLKRHRLISAVAERVGVSGTAVTKCLKHDAFQNEEIVSAAIETIVEEKQKLAEKIEALSAKVEGITS